jgi:hypothetical protein
VIPSKNHDEPEMEFERCVGVTLNETVTKDPVRNDTLI